jgi:hypothetical protein
VPAEQLSRRRRTRTATPAMRPPLRHHLVPQLLKPEIRLRGGHEGVLRFPSRKSRASPCATHSERRGPDSRACAKSIRYVSQSGLLGVTNLNSSDTEEAAFLRRLGDPLADATQPSFKGSCMAGCLSAASRAATCCVEMFFSHDQSELCQFIAGRERGRLPRALLLNQLGWIV